MNNLKGNPGRWWFWSVGVNRGLKALGIACLSGQRSLCHVVAVAGVRLALVHGVAPVGEVVSVVWGATMPIVITV